MSFLKKLLRRLEGRSAAEKEEVIVETQKSSNQKASVKTSSESMMPNLDLEEDAKAKPNANNIVELEERVIIKVIRALKVLSFGESCLKGLKFHFRAGANSPEGVAGQELFQSEAFREHLLRELDGIGVNYQVDCHIDLLFHSAHIEEVTLLSPNLGFEIILPQREATSYIALLCVDKGLAWQDEYHLNPKQQTTWKIGRGKEAKLDDHSIIKNDIAFISWQEKQEERYRINDYVSRSIAIIDYHEKGNVFVLKRSNLMNNLQHTIKVISKEENGERRSYSLGHHAGNHILKDQDRILFNDMIEMTFKKQMH